MLFQGFVIRVGRPALMGVLSTLLVGCYSELVETESVMTGGLTIIAATTGLDPDPDGYTVTVDGMQSQTVLNNGAAGFVELLVGEHVVELTGIATNCTVDQNPQTVTVVVASTVQLGFAVTCVDRGPVFSEGLWITVEELAVLPMSGKAWDEVQSAATGNWGSADVSDQDNQHDVLTFAGALYAERTDDDMMRMRVRDAIDEAVGTEAGGRTLALGRQLLGYVLAADLIGYRAPAFLAWVDAVRTTTLEGRAGIDNLLDSAMQDPSNWGCHARASMIAAARYLGDSAQVAVLAGRLQDYLGRSGSGFRFGELWWQADPAMPVGINPVGATILGNNVDGVIPDDQRRGGRFRWPPPSENYAWEALQGTVTSAHLLERAGYPAWEWEDRAILRAVTWLHDEPNYPAEGNDMWMPWRINAAYGTSFPARTGRPTGTSVGYTSWTHR